MSWRTTEQLKERYDNALACPSTQDGQPGWREEKNRRIEEYVAHLEAENLKMRGQLSDWELERL